MGHLVQGSVLVTRAGRVVFTSCDLRARAKHWPWHLLSHSDTFSYFLSRFGNITECGKTIVVCSVNADEDALAAWFGEQTARDEVHDHTAA